ncbi:hypothetical protein ERJ75_000776100 [Trypanosoma vivax]|uniref:Uncharacterized protein n=1 Tax=Trypanosoma vivax (strain Y486) TaxID=1055687 RepID=G0U3G8_TRYVY|nr:hypothetical protein ERJ75_000776100 [Trypanosoma vivax]CCC50825.1 conserved hypothetical protein [Trypanosoma vivax Y486]
MENCAEECEASPLHSPGRVGLDNIIAAQAISPHEKVRQFFEEQDQKQSLATASVAGVEGGDEVQGVVSTDNTSSPTKEVLKDGLEVTPSKSGKRKRGGVAEGSTPKRCKRSRQDITSLRSTRRKVADYASEESTLALFRRSQRALRNEGQRVNIKEVLSRSFSVRNDTQSDMSESFTLSGVSQESSAWSPTIVTSITNQFLSNVRQKKKETLERLLQQELTNSQQSFTENVDDTRACGATMELVIGEESDAVMGPPSSTENALGVESTTMEVTMGSVSSQTDLQPFTNSTQRSVYEPNEEEEQAQSQALMRKRELWRIRQQHLRAQMLLDERNSQSQSSNQRTAPNMNTPAAASASIITSSTVDVDCTFDTVMMMQRGVLQKARGSAIELSTDHIEMIRRANSFNSTSSQRVVVFETRKGPWVVSSVKENERE